MTDDNLPSFVERTARKATPAPPGQLGDHLISVPVSGKLIVTCEDFAEGHFVVRIVPPNRSPMRCPIRPGTEWEWTNDTGSVAEVYHERGDGRVYLEWSE